MGRDPRQVVRHKSGALTPLIVAGLAAGAVVFALLFGLARLVLRGSSRAHRVLTESGILLFFGVPLSSIQMVSDLNITLDRSSPVAIDQQVTEKYTRTTIGRGGRRRTHYYIALAPSAPNPLGIEIPRQLQVGPAIYRRIQTGRNIGIEMRQGALAIPWVEDISPR